MRTSAVALAVVTGACGAACASAGPEPDPVARVAAPIIGGEASNEDEDAVVLVMHYDALQTGGGTGGCTGTMLTPRLVLTARHCVSLTDASAACNEEGKADFGGAVKGDHKASALYVFAGTTRPDFIGGLARAARGAEVLTNGASTICNNDIALILLEKPLEGAKIAPVRIDAGPEAGERVTVVGWGVTDSGPQPEVRQRRAGVGIEEVGPALGLGPTEFRLGESTCSGDSGGPALSERGAVLGVLSRGGNGSGADPGTADACVGGQNVFVSVAGHAELIREAYAKAGQEIWREGEPNPTLAKLGGACATDAECQSSLCDTAASVCSQDCAQAACPSGFRCADRGGRKLCEAAPEDEDGGCSASGRAPRRAELAFVGVLAAAVLARVRRRR